MNEALYEYQLSRIRRVNNFLVLSKADGLKEQDLSPIAARMLLQNQVPHLLPCSLEHRDEDITLLYQLNSKKS